MLLSYGFPVPSCSLSSISAFTPSSCSCRIPLHFMKLKTVSMLCSADQIAWNLLFLVAHCAVRIQEGSDSLTPAARVICCLKYVFQLAERLMAACPYEQYCVSRSKFKAIHQCRIWRVSGQPVGPWADSASSRSSLWLAWAVAIAGPVRELAAFELPQPHPAWHQTK